VRGRVVQAWSALRAAGDDRRRRVTTWLTADDDESTSVGSWRDIAGVLQVAIPVGAGLLAAATRFAADWLYGSYGVTSDEVGLSVPSLVLQSAAVVVGTALAVVAVAVVGGVVWRSAALRSLAFLAAAIQGTVDMEGSLPARLVNNLLGAGVLLGVSWALSPPGRRPRHDRGRHWRRLAGPTAVIAGGGLIVGNLVLANEARLLIDAGEPATYAIGPVQAIGVRAQVVRVYGLADQEVADGSCAHFFGRAHGVTVLRTRGRVVRAPTEEVTLRSSRCTVPDD